MKVRSIISRLTSLGYKVSYYERKDGGVLIRSINGQKFTAAKGNVYARTILGLELTTRRSEQLHKITRARSYYKTHTIETPEDLEKFRKSVMRKWKKAGLRGSISKYNLKRMIADRGIEGAKEYLIKMEMRAEGKAYDSLVEALISRIEQDIAAVNDDLEEVEWLQKIKKLVEDNKEDFKREWIFIILDELYNWESPAGYSMTAHDLYLKVEALLS